jgi:tetratricopeptide (TPR) repeat protein
VNSRIRAIVVGAVAAAIALALLRGPIAESLVVRGDTFLYRTQPSRAITYYRRAVSIDSGDGTAVDRFAFVALTERDRVAMRTALEVCSRFLGRNPNDWTIRFDRALLFHAAGNARRAEADFAMVGRAEHDARALAFAGFAARASGREHAARAYWRTALSLSPKFAAARHALDEPSR